MPNINYIFVDLDNVLIYADSIKWWPDDEKYWPVPKESTKLVVFNDNSQYRGILRPGALEFLERLRGIPNTKVFMLTASVTEYANAWDRTFGLGFGSTGIFAREDMAGISHLDPSAFPNPRVVALFDDLPEFEHRHRKLPFICAINPPTYKVNYVRVPAFNGVGSLKPETIQALIAKGLELSS